MNKTRIWIIGLSLLALMLPVWPVEGWMLGIPLWAWLAVGAAGAMGVFIAYVTLVVWQDPEDAPEQKPHV